MAGKGGYEGALDNRTLGEEAAVRSFVHSGQLRRRRGSCQDFTFVKDSSFLKNAFHEKRAIFIVNTNEQDT